MRRTVIDLGTHTFLLLMVDLLPDKTFRIIREEERFVGLGQGVSKSNHISSDALVRAEKTLLEYRDILRTESDNGPVRVVATAVLRDTANAEVVRKHLEKCTGFSIQVIPGEEEARLTFLAAVEAFPCIDKKIVADIGGGSVEVSEGDNADLKKRISLPIGAIRLTERFLPAFPVSAKQRRDLNQFIESEFTRVLSDYDRSGNRSLIGMSGTFTTAASMAQALTDYQPEKLSGFRFTVQAAATWEERLSGMTLSEQRALPGLKPQRAGLIVAGMALIKHLCLFFNTDSVLVCNHGLRFGVLSDWMAGTSADSVPELKFQ